MGEAESTKIGHVQIFDEGGEEIHASFWKPTGAYRLRVGWFGRLTLEREMVFETTPARSPYERRQSRWQKAPKGSVAYFWRTKSDG